MANKIGFIVENREIHANGVSQVTIRMMSSDKPHLATNELPLILNAIKGSQYTDQEIDNLGFTYTFPFALARGWGFPYVLDFEFDEDILTLT